MEVVRRIFDDTEGAYIEVGPDADGLDCIEVRTTNAKSKEYFGEFRFSLMPEMAKLLGNALIDAAESVKK